MRCAVCGCDSDNQAKKNPCRDVKFFRFPKDEEFRKKWVHATGREDKFNFKNSVVCSKHFVESDYKINLQHQLLKYTPKRYRGLKDDAIPNQNLPKSSFKTMASRSAVVKKKEQKQLVSDLLSR